MTAKEFARVYWAHYYSLEKEFIDTLNYVSLDIDNYKAYSEAYSKIILQVGSEVDVVLKVYCKILDFSFVGDNINSYRAKVKSEIADFATQEVEITITETKIKPWEKWDLTDPKNPDWWKAYNKIKHNRTDSGEIGGVVKEYYKFGNQENAFTALAGLYQVLIYAYYHLASAEGKVVKIPLPGSRLFELSGGIGDAIDFFKDFAFYIDNGTLSVEYGMLL